MTAQQAETKPAQPIEVPEGYRMDAKKRLVPEETIKEIDLARNDFVLEWFGKAKALQQQLQDFKLAALGDIGAFIDLSAERYNVQVGGGKGNISLVSFDGTIKIQRAIADTITFDEGLQAAKALVDNCITRWKEGSRNEIKVLADDAFNVDKEGKISVGRVLGLRRHNFDDPEWKKAMQAIADSIQVTGSKTYVRFYQRGGPDDKWEALSLDISKL